MLFINFYIKSERISDFLNHGLWRIDVKNFLKVSIISLGFVVFATTSSFALVDGAVWGGYVFKGELEGNNKDATGGNYGIKGHYNTSLFPLLELGVGAYYQYSKLTVDLGSNEDIKRSSIGLDANLILGTPIVHPYLRGTYSFVDKVDVAGESDTVKFKGYGYGAGLELTVAPFLRIFGEYMYDYSDHDSYLKSQSVKLGLKMDI